MADANIPRVAREADRGLANTAPDGTSNLTTVGTAGAGQAGPRLRFPTVMAADESIPGALHAGVRRHVLEHTLAALRAAGIAITRPGHVQLLPPDDLLRLAYVMRADPAQLLANAGERIRGAGEREVHQRARFGDLVLLRAELELVRRRIAPLALRTAPHHRLAWLNRTLPYCPVTLERMVERCGLCSAPLTWRTSWGVDTCETCREVVPPSHEAVLPKDLVELYRLYASLVSPLPDVRQAARAGLPGRLHGVDYASLARLACRLGLVCRDEPITCRQHALGDLPAETLASVVATGAGMLAGWPEKLRTHARERGNALRGDREGYLAWRTMLRRVAGTSDGDRVLATLMREALPDLDESIERSFADGDVYLPFEAQRAIGIPHGTLVKAIGAKGLDATPLPSLTRQRLQLPKARVDQVAHLVRNSPDLHKLAGPLGLSIHAVEQLLVADVLGWERDPAVLSIRRRPCAKADARRLLDERFDERAGTGRGPEDAVPLRAAARRIGGREKPWSAIVAAILDGTLICWSEKRTFDARAIRVLPNDMARFDRVRFDVADHGERGAAFPFEATVSQADAGDLLNVAPKYVDEAGRRHGFPFSPDGCALAAPRAAVLAFAADMASTGEIGLHLGVHAKAVPTHERMRGAARLSPGYNRKVLVSCGVLPPTPA